MCHLQEATKLIETSKNCAFCALIVTVFAVSSPRKKTLRFRNPYEGRSFGHGFKNLTIFLSLRPKNGRFVPVTKWYGINVWILVKDSWDYEAFIQRQLAIYAEAGKLKAKSTM